MAIREKRQKSSYAGSTKSFQENVTRAAPAMAAAYGLIGAACLARLHRDGHEVTGAGRSIAEARRRAPYAKWITADYRKLTLAGDWLPLLEGFDAVVNCVGVLQDGMRDDVQRVHVAAASALFAACERAGVRRVVHISAIGASRLSAYFSCAFMPEPPR